MSKQKNSSNASLDPFFDPLFLLNPFLQLLTSYQAEYILCINSITMKACLTKSGDGSTVTKGRIGPEKISLEISRMHDFMTKKSLSLFSVC
jgi:hypothetical protein